MKQSKLFRPDQYSYLLYPNKQLKGFMDRNLIPNKLVKKSKLLQQLVKDRNVQIIEQDLNGDFHFNGNLKNANYLKSALKEIEESDYKNLVESETNLILDIFEEVFNHKEFTGRSGTFYGYEGLGSIYWHMVSKLQLAVQECCLSAIEDQESNVVIGKLLEHYYEINEGIGVHKPAALYGAFPTDPYSHTPFTKGAQQPGMTGQVKEDILSRFGELGVFVSNGKLYFNPVLLRKNEFFKEQKTFNYVNALNQFKQLELKPNSLCFTYCMVPIEYTISNSDALTVYFKSGSVKKFDGLKLDDSTSEQVFKRLGKIEKIEVSMQLENLK